MTTHEFNNPATQREKREVLRNDTLFSRQQNAVDDAGGRYAKLTPATITGSRSLPQYPRLPESSPWASGFDENVEPPLGYAVDEVPAQSNLEVVGVEPSPGVDDLGGPMAPTDVSQSDVETGPPKSMKRKRW